MKSLSSSGYLDRATECYIEVPSDRVSFDQRPWMKAAEATVALVDELTRLPYGFARINYPNGDMVGHTGSLPAAIAACEAVDVALRAVKRALR